MVEGLTETIRGAKARLDIAKATAQGIGPRFGTAGDHSRLNAESYVRAWMKEVRRAERAQRSIAQRPTKDLQQRFRQVTAVGGKMAHRSRPITPPPVRKRRKHRKMASTVATPATSIAAAAAVVKAKEKRKIMAQQSQRKRSVEHISANSMVPKRFIAVGEEAGGSKAAEGLNASISRRSEVMCME